MGLLQSHNIDSLSQNIVFNTKNLFTYLSGLKMRLTTIRTQSKFSVAGPTVIRRACAPPQGIVI